MSWLSFELRPTPPFRLDLTVWALRRRARNILDRWDGATYRRVLEIRGAPYEVAVTQVGPRDRPRLAVTVTGRHLGGQLQGAVSQVLDRLLGLRNDLAPFYALAARDERLAPLAREYRGLKPPRFSSIFEALVNAVACQKLSLTVGIELLNRVACRCGLAFSSTDSRYYAFPRATDLLQVRPQTLRRLGFSYNKARSLLAVSREIASGSLMPERIDTLNDQSVVKVLMKVRGIGRWTAEYVLLRGCGRIHMFPGDDVGARNRLARWLGRDRPLDYEGVRRAVRHWQPYAGMVYFHLLLAGLTESGERPNDVERPTA